MTTASETSSTAAGPLAARRELAWRLEIGDDGLLTYAEVDEGLLEWARLASPASVLGLRPDEVLPPEPARQYVDELELLLATGRSRRFDLRYTTAGRRVALVVLLEPVLDDTGRCCAVLGRALDVSGEAEAHAAVVRLAETYGDARTPVAVIDGAGIVRWANDALGALVATSPASMRGRPLDDALGAEVDGRDDEVAVRCGARTTWVRLVRSMVTSAWGEVLLTLVEVEDVTAEREARERADRFRSLTEVAPVGIFFTDADGALRSCNARMCEITGLPTDALLDGGWRSALHADDARMVDEALVALPDEISLQCRVVRPDGELRWVQLRLAAVRDAGGDRTGLAGTLEDVTTRVWSEQALLEREAEYRLLASMSVDLISRHDLDGRFLYASPASAALLGIESFDLVGRPGLELVHPEDVPQVQAELRRLARLEQSSITCRLRRADGSYVWVESSVRNLRDGTSGERHQLVAVTRDISKHKQAEAALAHQALHDPLTGLPNRALLLDRIGQALAQGARHDHPVAALFLDLDNFKVINDSLGHDAGDRLLVAVAERLRTLVDADDTVARFGGDEFVIVRPELTGEDEVAELAHRVVTAFNQPFAAEGDLFATVSIGVAIAAAGRGTPDTLLRDADIAMYRAKERGGVRYEVFNEALRRRIVDRLETVTALHHAVERNELRLHYQPVVDLQTGETTSVEALVRWDHPERGLVLPGEFIGVAEASGLVAGIGAWVLGEACRQLRSWSDHRSGGGIVPSVAVNLSARQLNDPGIVDAVAQAVRDAGIDPSLLCLEVTESTVMEDAEASIGLLRDLRALGVSIAIDDFGTGYSSLSYLKRLPVDRLKVDRSFVSGLGDKLEDTAIVTAVIDMAHALGMRAVAEGVESERQLAELRTLGCDLAQGFLFARPLPAAMVASRVG